MSGPTTPAGSASRPAGGIAGKIHWLALALAVLVADQWSKWLIEQSLPLHTVRTVVDGLFNLTHVRNTGVAFGMFASRGEVAGTLLLTALGLVALTVVLLYFWRTPAEDHLLLASLALILGGAVGNLVDRISTGAVTDFLDFYLGTHHWHTFNIADSAITVGIGLMALDILLPSRRRRRSG